MFKILKKQQANTNPLTEFIGSLILSKSPLLVQHCKDDYEREIIINRKYIHSKCDSMIYSFTKYCLVNRNYVSVHCEDEPCYDGWAKEWFIFENGRGFKFFSLPDGSVCIFIANRNEWVEYSTSKYDYDVLADLYRCIKNFQVIEANLEKQRRNLKCVEQYNEMYRC